MLGTDRRRSGAPRAPTAMPRSTPARPFAALLVAAFLVALPAAQDPVVFDPAIHLAGYSEAQDDPHRALYDFGAFDRWKGQRIGADELAALRALWQAQQRRVASDVKRRRPSLEQRGGSGRARRHVLGRVLQFRDQRRDRSFDSGRQIAQRARSGSSFAAPASPASDPLVGSRGFGHPFLRQLSTIVRDSWVLTSTSAGSISISAPKISKR